MHLTQLYKKLTIAQYTEESKAHLAVELHYQTQGPRPQGPRPQGPRSQGPRPQGPRPQGPRPRLAG